MKRRLKITAVIILVLLILALMIVEAVRRSDLPRSLVAQALRDKLNANVELGSLRPSWSGRTTLTNLKLSDPLTGDILARFPTIQVRHTALLWLLLTQSVTVESVLVPSGELHVRQSPLGEWNLANLIVPSQDSSPPPPPGAIPRIQVQHLVVHLHRPEDRSVEIADVRVVLSPVTGARKFNLEVDAATLGRITGSVAMAGNQPHDMRFELGNLAKVAALWTANPPVPLQVKGRWRGQLDGDVLTGLLTLDDLQVNAGHVNGRVRVIADGADITVESSDLVATGLPGIDRDVRLTDGRVRYNHQRVNLERVEAQAFGGNLTAGGTLNLSDLAAQVTVHWSGLRLPERLDHDGSLTLQITPTAGGRFEARAQYQLDALTSPGKLQVRGKAALDLDETQRLTGDLSFETLDWQNNAAAVHLPGLTAHVELDRKGLEISQLQSPPESDLMGTASWHFADQTWQLALKGEQLPIQVDGLPPARFSLQAKGTPETVDLTELVLKNQDRIAITANGTWQTNARDNPLHANLRVAMNQPLRIEQGGVNFSAAKSQMSWQVVGSTSPMNLTLDGSLSAESLRLGQHVRPALDLPIHGTYRNDQLNLTAQPVTLLDGRWQIDGQWQRRTGDLQVTLAMNDVALARGDDVAGEPLALHGKLSGKLLAVIPGLDPGQMRLTGDWQVKEPGWHDLRAQEVQGKIELLDDGLQLTDVRMRQGIGRAEGTMRIDPQTDAVRMAFTASDWPVHHQSTGLDALVNASGKVDMNARAITFDGPVEAQATMQHDGQAIGDVRLAVKMHGREMTLQTLTGAVLGGELTGSGKVNLDQPAAGELDLALEQLQLDELARIWPAMSQTSGKLDARFQLKPNDDLRAPGPTQATLTLEGHHAMYRKVALRTGRATLSLVPADQAAASGRWLDRLLLEQSHWRFDQGQVDVRGRLTWRSQGWYYYVYTELSDVDIARSISDLSQEQAAGGTQGILSGSMMLTGSLNDASQRFGTARLDITEADLANEGLVAGIYNLFNLNLDPSPTGTGEAQLRLTGNRLTIRRASYHNRGLHLFVAGQLDDVTQGRAASIAGHAVVISQVLPELPVFRQIGQTIAGMQGYTNAVKFTGTWNEPTVRWQPLEEVESLIQRLVPLK